jgi:polyketide biosynthesis acyl carrier protein
MTENEIFAVVTRHLVEVLPELEGLPIAPAMSLRELGANSIDRMDVLLAAQEELGLRIPAADFGTANDLASLVEVLARHAAGAVAP